MGLRGKKVSPRNVLGPGALAAIRDLIARENPRRRWPAWSGARTGADVRLELRESRTPGGYELSAHIDQPGHPNNLIPYFLAVNPTAWTLAKRSGSKHTIVAQGRNA